MMSKIYIAFVTIGILLGSILVVENSIFSLPAYIFFWNKGAGMLAIISIAVGMLMGYGIKGLQSSGKEVENYDDF